MENRNGRNLPAIPEFALAPRPPAPVVGIDPQLDHLVGLSLAGHTQAAAIFAHAFQVQHQLLTYAMHLRNSTQDEYTRNYLDRLIYQLMQAANQAVMSVAVGTTEQILAHFQPAAANGHAPAEEPEFSWKRYLFDDKYQYSPEFERICERKGRLWKFFFHPDFLGGVDM